jgi:hypothetical protein
VATGVFLCAPGRRWLRGISDTCGEGSPSPRKCQTRGNDCNGIARIAGGLTESCVLQCGTPSVISRCGIFSRSVPCSRSQVAAQKAGSAALLRDEIEAGRISVRPLDQFDSFPRRWLKLASRHRRILGGKSGFCFRSCSIHSNVKIAVGMEWRLNRFIVTARMHGIHHAIARASSRSPMVMITRRPARRHLSD